MKNKIKKIGVGVLILAVLIIAFGYSLNTYAQSETPDLQCQTTMRPFLDKKSKEFRDYLTQNFQNKSTNSSLLDLALKRFELYKKDLRNNYIAYYAQPTLSLESETLDTLSCYQQMEDEIKLSEELLKKYFTQTSNIKTTSAVMDKLKAINAKLDKLSASVTQMYGKLETFKNNIPCIIDKCI